MTMTEIRALAKEWTQAIGSPEAALEHALSILHGVDLAINTKFLGRVSAGFVREPPESLLPMKVTAEGPPTIAEFPAGSENPL